MPSGDDDESSAFGDSTDWPETGLSRRTLLRTAGAASLAAPALLADDEAEAAEKGAGAGAGAVKGQFFNAADLAMVDELAEMIVPADGHSPGAREAAVAREIDRRLHELFAADPLTPPRRRMWREGLRRLDALAAKLSTATGKTFMTVTPQQRLAVLTEIARNELTPATPEELFFVELKREATRAYYTSEIGIAKELEYKGNTYLPDFVGHDAAAVPLTKIRKGP